MSQRERKFKTTSHQRRYNVNATLYKCHVPAGYIVIKSSLRGLKSCGVIIVTFSDEVILLAPFIFSQYNFFSCAFKGNNLGHKHHENMPIYF